MAYFPSVAAACAAARMVMMSERTSPRLNLLDRPPTCRIEDRSWLGFRRDAPAVLVFTGADSDAIDTRITEDADGVQLCCTPSDRAVLTS